MREFLLAAVFSNVLGKVKFSFQTKSISLNYLLSSTIVTVQPSSFTSTNFELCMLLTVQQKRKFPLNRCVSLKADVAAINEPRLSKFLRLSRIFTCVELVSATYDYLTM